MGLRAKAVPQWELQTRHKLKKPDLRLALYTLFSTYGTVLDVVAMKTAKMRGQAHIVFRDIQASTQAMRALQGFDFFGKEMKIVYAKGSSDIIAKLRGTWTAASGAAPGVSTELQKSIFSGPPTAAAPGTVPPKPAGEKDAEGDQGPQGVKRPRDEESDEGDAPMEEDESDVSMEASSDED
ncbi:U2 snRNP complex subunit msl1 [Arachnomyces sp. PD_36]|nr:U2 snRNP complex subunit msl1 [Arachnomyces sp. PD_36]